MWEHCRDFHEGNVGENGGMLDYKFGVTGVCLDRQVDEGLRIFECEANGTVLNSKNKFYTQKIVHPEFRQQ